MMLGRRAHGGVGCATMSVRMQTEGSLGRLEHGDSVSQGESPEPDIGMRSNELDMVLTYESTT
jgi:hypothetical protein